MAFAVASSGTSADAFSPSCVITAPSGITVGDYLTAHIVYGKNAGEPTITPPTGFTSLKKENGETSSVHQVWGKVADAGDAAAGTFTFSWTGNQNNRGGMLRITGQKTSTPADVTNSVFSNSNSATITITTVTPTDANSLFILSGGILSTETFSAYAMATDNPTWVEDVDVNDNPSLFIAHAFRPQSTASGNITITQSASDHASAIVVVIRPQPVNVTISPAVVTAIFSVLAVAVTGSANVSPSVLSLVASVQAPTVTTAAAKWTNVSKNTATFTNATKHSAALTNQTKNSSTWSNTSKTP